MKRLAIETATETCSVALFEQGRLLAHVHERVGRGHAERLIPMIATLPSQGRADEILVDCGPGSFTGVRVGLAAARALGFAWNAPVKAYSSLALIAATAFRERPELGRLAVVTIGGHGEYFVQLFGNGPLLAVSPLASLKPAEVADTCVGLPVVGSGADAIQVTGAIASLPGIEADARCTALLPAALVDLPPVPVYGRAPDARPPA